MDKELCSSKSSNESTSVDSQCSDEDSTLTSNTPESLSPINSKKKFEISDTYNSNILSIVMNEVGCASPFLSGNPNHLESKECIKVDLNSSPSAPVSITNLKSLTVEETTDVKSSSIFRRLEDFSVSDSIQSPHLSDRNSRSTPQDATTCRQDYLVQAAYHVGQAQKCEVEEEFEAAFCFYKAAIACLMNGVQDDEEEVRRQAVKEKANQYLQRAEKIYAMHLAQNSEIGLTRTSAFEELKIYKVLRIIDSVMLALNTSDGKCYVIKVLQKSPCPINVKKKTTIPYNVPYMVKLHKYFENENSIFLVLQYAKRGKLWDHLFDPSKSNLFWNKEGSIQFSSSRFQLKKTFGNDFKRHCCVPGVEPSSKHIVSVKDYEGTNNCTQDLHSEKNKIVSSIEPLQYEEKSLDKYEKNERNIEEKEEAGAVNAEALEVTSLVENSQRLLNSVNKTLKNSEKLTNNLNKELTDIETVFDFKCKLIMSDELSINMNSKNKKKRSRSAVEKSHSSEVCAVLMIKWIVTLKYFILYLVF